ncbi:hypothetical protein BC835DRAFT_667384 [Cytidiella melzeri]|nr:hypothetical protein BC835DRAFT_667384 [Cytidiella melzeri]
MVLLQVICFLVSVVCLCVYEEVYPSAISQTSLQGSRIARSWLSLVYEVLQSLLRILEVSCKYCGLTKAVWTSSTQLKLRESLEILALRTTEEVQSMLKQQALDSSQIQDTSPFRRQVDLLRAKAEVISLRRRNADLDFSLRDALSREEELKTIVARNNEDIAELHSNISDEKRRHAEDVGRERQKAAQPLEKAERLAERLANDLEVAQATQSQSLLVIQEQENVRKQLADQLDEYKTIALHDNATVAQTQRDYAILVEEFSLAEQKYKDAVRYLVFALVFFYRFARYLSGRLGPILRSKNTLFSQWKILSVQKVHCQRQLIRALDANGLLHVQLEARSIQRSEFQQVAQAWYQKYTKSVEDRERACKKFVTYIQRTKGRFNSSTRRLLTGILFLWRLNLLLSQRLGVTGSILRAIENAPEPVGIVSLSRIEEVSEPSGSASSIVSLMDATTDVKCTSSLASGLGISLCPPLRLTSEMSTQTSEEETMPPVAPCVQEETREFQSCAVDTADMEPSTMDACTMTEPNPEDAVLRERMARLNQKFTAMETVDSVYLKLLVKKTQPPPPQGSSQQPSQYLPHQANRLPFVGRIGVSVQPSEVRQPFVPRPISTRTRSGCGKKETHIFTQPLAQFPFPLPAYARPNGEPSTPGTPTPASGSGRRQPFLLSPGNSSFN